jgi:cytidyltransferase-like protein
MKVLTIGTFDILHWGHLDFLRQCSRFGDVVVGVNTDDFVTTFKREPIMKTYERCHAVRAAGYSVRENDSPGRELIEKEEPDVLAVGSDWARKDYMKQIDVTQDWLDEHHIMLLYIPYVQKIPISSSEIKRRIDERKT